MRTLGEVLEEALVQDPHDRAAHMAYADWLSEQSDPALAARGEFIAVQLALEEAPPPAERQRLEERQKQLLAAWRRAWLGELAPWLLDGRRDGWRSQIPILPTELFRFCRGWLDHLVLHDLTIPMARVVAEAASLRLLRSLTVWRDRPGFRRPEEGFYATLAHSSYLPHVGTLTLIDLYSPGSPGPRWDLPDLIASLPALERLEFQDSGGIRNSWPGATFRAVGPLSLPRLRSLSFTSQWDSFPFPELSANSSLQALERLSFTNIVGRNDHVLPDGLADLVRARHWHALRHLRVALELDDEGYQIICTSPLIEQLDSLELGPLGQGESIAYLIDRFPRMKAFRRVASGRWERRPRG
jgi:uncharacterized protein (TIGR02996 family)